MEYPNAPTGIAASALIVREGKVLLGKRTIDPYKGYWSLIGGFVDPNESLEDALRREIEEETSGCKLKRCKYFLSLPEKYGERQTLTVMFICEIEGEPQPSLEMSDFKWVMNEVSSLAFSDSKILHEYFKLSI